MSILQWFSIFSLTKKKTPDVFPPKAFKKKLTLLSSEATHPSWRTRLSPSELTWKLNLLEVLSPDPCQPASEVQSEPASGKLQSRTPPPHPKKKTKPHRETPKTQRNPPNQQTAQKQRVQLPSWSHYGSADAERCSRAVEEGLALLSSTPPLLSSLLSFLLIASPPSCFWQGVCLPASLPSFLPSSSTPPSLLTVWTFVFLKQTSSFSSSLSG